MLMVSCTGDWTKHTPKEEFPLMQKMYELYDARARVENAHIDAKHNYNADSRAAVYRFLAKHMQPSLTEAELVERPITGQWKAADLLGKATPASPTAQELFAAWKRMSREQCGGDSGHWRASRSASARVFHLDTESPHPQQTLCKAGKGDPLLVAYSGAAEAAAEFCKPIDRC